MIEDGCDDLHKSLHLDDGRWLVQMAAGHCCSCWRSSVAQGSASQLRLGLRCLVVNPTQLLGGSASVFVQSVPSVFAFFLNIYNIWKKETVHQKKWERVRSRKSFHQTLQGPKLVDPALEMEMLVPWSQLSDHLRTPAPKASGISRISSLYAKILGMGSWKASTGRGEL